MATTNPILQSQTLVLFSPQPQYGSAPEHTTRAFSGAGLSATTTTFTHPLVSAAAVGLLVIPEDGRAKDQQRYVKSVAGTTATIDSPWFDITGTTSIRGWLLGEVPFAVTTGSLTSVIASSHAGIAAEPDGFWVDYQAVCLAGANAGRAFTVSTWTASSGTALLTGTPATISIGDLWVMRRMIRLAAPITATVETPTNARTVIGTGSRGADMAMVLANKGTLSMEIEQRPLKTAGASTVQAVPPIEMGGILRTVFVESKDTGGAIASVDANGFVGTGGLYSVNGAALFNNGCVAPIWSTNTGAQSATVTKYAPGTANFATSPPTVASVVYGGVGYTRAESGYMHSLFDVYQGGKVKQYFGGAMPSLKIMINRQDAARFQLGFMPSDAFEWNLDRPVAYGAAFPLVVPDLGIPTSGQGARCVIDGISVILNHLEMDIGLEPGLRESLSGVMQNDGCVMGLKAPSGTIKIYADQDQRGSFMALKDRMRSGRPFAFTYQRDTAAGRTFWLHSPSMQFTGGTFGYDGTPAQGVFTMPFQCVDPDLAVDYGNVALYPPATYPGLKAVSLGVI